MELSSPIMSIIVGKISTLLTKLGITLLSAILQPAKIKGIRTSSS